MTVGRARALCAAATLIVAGMPSALAADSRALDPAKVLTQYSVDVWTTADDLPQNSVTSLAQTPDGYLWLGTYSGLVRFDGVRFQVFDVASGSGLESNGVQALLVDRSGALWVGTNGGGVSRLEGGRFHTLTAGDGLGSDIVRALHQDRSGTVWIGTAEGLVCWREGRLTRYSTADGLSHRVVRAIAEDAAGVLWIGTSGGGVDRFDGRAFRPFTTRDGLRSNAVFALLRASDGALWIGTNGGGLSRLHDGRLRHFTSAEGLPSDIVWSLHEDAAGSVWVGTYGGGLARVRGERVEVLSTREGLADDFVRAVLSDREGSLWVGTYGGGLCRLRDGKFTTYTVREGLGHDFARTILEDRDGSVWVGTTGGGLCRLQNGRFACRGAREGLADDVRALHQDGDGTLWVGTAGAGMFRLQRGRSTRLGVPDGLAHPNVSAIVGDGAGGLWVGTNGGGLSRFSGGRWTTLAARDGLAGDFVLAVHRDRRGRLWVGTDGAGLSRLESGRFTTYTRKDGLAADIVFALHEDAEGTLWIGTAGGLSRCRDGRFASFTTREGLADDVVFQVLEDDRGRLWLSGNRGISRVDRAELDAVASGARSKVNAVAYGIGDGMKSNECAGIAQPAGVKGRDGRLWFPTVRGIVAVDPARLPRNDLPPPVHIERVVVDGAPLASADVPPGRQRWEFHYTALSFLAPRKVRFRYRLEGFDPDWIEAGTQRAAYYTRLPPGRYTFQVSACNNDGVWNDEGASFSLRVQPHFHETPWFYALVAIVLAVAGAAAYGMRVRHLHARRRELEDQVEARTHDLLVEKERSEAARDEARRQKEIAEAADRTKTELLSIAAHELKSPLQSIIGYGELLGVAEDLARAREHASYSSAAARRMLHTIQQLLHSDALERGALSTAHGPVDLAGLAGSLVDALRPQAEAKRQTVEVSLPGPCIVEGDEEWLRQVVENLVGNAIKYSPQGSPITVEVRRTETAVVLAVQDKGPGLTADDLSHVFGRFQRLSARPTGGEPATGLGLYLVKQVVERHGGRVWAESEGAGKGARFVVELPTGPEGREGP